MGVAVIDRYTYYHLEFLEHFVKDANSNATLAEQFAYVDAEKCMSTPGIRTDLFKRDLRNVKVTDFFGGLSAVDIDKAENIPLTGEAVKRDVPMPREEIITTKAPDPFQQNKYGAIAMLVSFILMALGMRKL